VTSPTQPRQSLTALLERSWETARTVREGVRAPAFRLLAQRLDGGALHDAPPPVLLADGGEAFRAMLDAIAGAREEVLLETYILRDDRVGAAVRDALRHAGARGVRVCVMADAVGSVRTGEAFWQALAAPGVAVRLFHRVWHRPWSLLQRDHRKLLVVDRAVAFTGGMNIGEEYGSSMATHAGAWRDLLIAVRGPVAAELAAVFAEGWDRAGGAPLPGLEYVSWADGVVVPPGRMDVRAVQARWRRQWALRRDKRRGRRVRRPTGSAGATASERGIVVQDLRPGRGQREFLATLSALTGAARERLWVCTPYFAPPDWVLWQLGAAARRGVDVRVLVPGEETDVPLARLAAQGAYAALLTHGVRIFEYQGAMLHAKALVVDGHATLVGSSNLDFRSFWLNAEVNLLVLDDGCAAAMEAQYQRDLTSSREITVSGWRARPWWARVAAGAARLLRWGM
jgi:cardiolipin synthase